MAIYKSTQTHSKFIQLNSGKFFSDFKSVKNNLPLLVEFSYIDSAPYKTGVRFDSLNDKAGSRLDSDMRYFCARKPTHTRIMAGRDGGAFALAGSFIASLSTPLRLATPFDSEVARLLKSDKGASIMASSAYPKFLWRFFSCQQSKYFTVEATSEQEARSMLPDAPCLFSARICQRQRQGVSHA